MADEQVIFRFRDRGRIRGIPARDLTQRDLDRMSLEHQRDVRAGTLYEAVGDVDEVPRSTAPDFDSMTKAQLVAYAAEHSVDIGDLDESSRKDDLVAAVKGGE